MELDYEGIEFTTDDKVRIFLKLAYDHASKFSDDQDTHTGAIITNANGTLIGKGANTLSAGVMETEERTTRPLKYKYIEHAERNAIYYVAGTNNSTKDAIMYMPWVPCMDCGRAIANSGIHTLIMHKQLVEKTPEHWHDDVKMAFEMLKEAGVVLKMFDGEIGDNTQHQFNKEIWNP